MPRTISSNGVTLLQFFEGLGLKAYQDSAGVWTIGYGRTKGVKPGDTCTQEQALKWLIEDDLVDALADTNKHVGALGSQHQFDALTVFCYNVGGPALASSTLLKVLKAQGPAAVTQDMLTRWNKAKVKGKLTVLRGLTRRRMGEWRLWNTPDGETFDPIALDKDGAFDL